MRVTNMKSFSLKRTIILSNCHSELHILPNCHSESVDVKVLVELLNTRGILVILYPIPLCACVAQGETEESSVKCSNCKSE